mmetsp:Transcript_74943/g.112959  ORF Transcript_74943/g.112959 Transcript_74943/m.112959 type:complete len:338 (+) Transcript_74943:601-1614(+)
MSKVSRMYQTEGLYPQWILGGILVDRKGQAIPCLGIVQLYVFQPTSGLIALRRQIRSCRLVLVRSLVETLFRNVHVGSVANVRRDVQRTVGRAGARVRTGMVRRRGRQFLHEGLVKGVGKEILDEEMIERFVDNWCILDLLKGRFEFLVYRLVGPFVVVRGDDLESLAVNGREFRFFCCFCYWLWCCCGGCCCFCPPYVVGRRSLSRRRCRRCSRWVCCCRRWGCHCCHWGRFLRPNGGSCGGGRSLRRRSLHPLIQSTVQSTVRRGTTQKHVTHVEGGHQQYTDFQLQFETLLSLRLFITCNIAVSNTTDSVAFEALLYGSLLHHPIDQSVNQSID